MTLSVNDTQPNNDLLFAECHYSECCIFSCVECHYSVRRYAECRNAKCHNAECHYSVCRYAECHYAERRGAQNPVSLKSVFQIIKNSNQI
jgi:hypothetical protein